MEQRVKTKDSLSAMFNVPAALSINAERHQLLVEWNDTATEYPRDRCVHELFEEQAAQTPDAVAVVFGDQQLTYRQLNERANQLAHHLRKLGVGPETLVGLLVERSTEMIVGLMGILKSGGAYVPLDDKSPEHRLRHQLNDIKVLLTQQRTLAKLPAFPGPLICLDDDPHTFNQFNKNNLLPSAVSENLAYVIYTSGSTGAPKGVLITHRNLVNYTFFMRQRLGLADFLCGLKFALVSSIAADLGNTCIYSALLSGGSLHLVDTNTSVDPEGFADYVSRNVIDVLKITPSHLAALLIATNPQRILPSRFLILGGEVLTSQMVKQIQKLRGSCRIINHYGPTETTIGSLTLGDQHFGTSLSSNSNIPLGRPIANTRCYILDEGLELVPVGVAGELYLGGDGLARGYLNRPELTAEKFITDPFSAEPGARLYRTGDLARYRPDGNIEFLGRRDQQVKLRGFRIELGEIEAVLAAHPQMAQAAVIAREDVPGNKTLAAYLVVQEPAPELTELRDFLLAQLPDYMVPAAFVILDKLPLTPNGKLDRAALPAPGQNRLGPAAEPVAPRTPTETALAHIWAGLLGLPQVGIHDNFFALGGHSLLAVRMIFRIRETFKTALPVKVVFELPTIAELSAAVDAARKTIDSPLRLARLDRSTADGKFATSYGQEQLWFLDQLTPGSAVYNVPLAIRLRGLLNPVALAKSLNHLVQRHEVLRTTFLAENGVPRQVVAPHLDLKLAVLDLEKFPVQEREAELQRRLLASAGRSFDLSRGPLLRAELFRLAEEDQVLLLTVHHIVFDGWSVEVLLRELMASYTAFGENRTPEPVELSVQYVDFAAWQRQQLTAEKVEQHLGYWRRQLAGVPMILELPASKPRPLVADHAGAHQHFTLPPELTSALRQLAHAQGTTLFVTLLAAFQTLLYRCSGQPQILVGSPLSGRTLEECEGLIGFFANVLPLKADFANQPPFTALMQQLHQTVWEAQDHQELPFEKLVQALQPQRDLSRNPVFQIVFVFESEPLPLDQMGAVKLERESLKSPIVKFDLTLSLSEKNGSLHGSFEYATEIFEPADIRRLPAYYQNLLTAIVADPTQLVSALPLLSPAERHQLLVEWNDTATEYPRDRCVHELFEEQAAQTPDAVAVVFGDQQLTYRQLNERANQLAHHLRKLGVGPETLVGLLVDRSTDYLASILAVLKAGGAYLPLDSDYPVARLQFMLADAGAKVLITQQSPPADLNRQGITVVDLKQDAALIGAGSKNNPGLHNTPDQLAYVIYTSGSTGQPKGVAIPHRGVVRLVRGQSYARFDARQRFLLLASTSFDAATFETWGPLLNGAVCVVFPSQPLDLEQLEVLIRREKVICLWLTAGLFNQIIDARPSVLATVEQVLTGGEALSVPHVRKALHLLPQLQLINGYGPTESTTFACCHSIKPGDSFGSIPLGRPIANTRCYILDEGLELVPVGVAGELYLGGDGLARGYLNRPELTAEKFITDPFSAEPGARLYRTGDLARYRPDGNIEFLGRRDQQVKLRGFRIELGEIEAVLAAHPQMAQAAVIAREDVPGNKTLAAYLVVQEPAPELTELRDFLLAQLPDYMVPAAFVILDKLPLTPNGKLDRAALPAPGQNRLGPAAEPVAPRTPTETALAHIWAGLLGLPQVGIHDNFFALGGHSLLAVRMIFRIRETFKTALPVKVVFELPTIAELSAAVDAARKTIDSPLRLARLDRSTADGKFATSYGQEQLWFLDQLTPGSAVYNVPLAIRLRGLLNPVALAKSLNHLVQRHEVLRTTFLAENGVPRQVVAPHLDLKLAVLDLEKFPVQEREAELQRRLLASAGRSFDLSRGPLLRAELFRLAEEDQVLLLTVHHIVFDGWSVEVLLRELMASYTAFGENRTPEPVELSVQYVDFAAWQRQQLTAEKVEQHLGYWRRQLAGVPMILELPASKPRPLVADHAGAHQHFTLPPELTSALRQLAHAQGTTLFVTLLAAFQTLLYRCSGQPQILVGSPLSGRTLEECEGLIGFFANVLPLKADFANQPPFTALMQQLHQTVWEAQDHQELPFEKLVQALQPQRDLSRNPVFQIVFVFESEPLPLDQMGAVKLERESLKSPIVKFDLTLSLSEKNGSLHGSFEYATEIFEPADIRRLPAYYQNLLTAIVADPTQLVSALPLLSPAERHQLLVEWNDTATEYPRDRCVHELFEEQAAQTPDAVAVVFGDQQLTYRQLNERANQLAHHLRKLGVGPETLVGLLVDRSTDYLASILAVLKAGGAYLPLDSDYPVARLQFMLADAGAKVLITQQSPPADLNRQGITVVDLKQDAALIGAGSKNNPGLHNTPDQLAYVIYTSGSTGQPKGVAIPHRGVVRLVRGQSYARFDARQRFLLLASTSFDAATFETWGPLLNGAVCVVFPSQPLDLEQLEVLIRREKVICLWLTAGLFNQIIDARPSVLATVEQVLTGGEALSVPHVRKALHLLPQLQLINGYGPTESTTFACCHSIKPGDSFGSIPLGRPIANTRCYILDEGLELVPVGVAGELYLGGDGLARGYLNRPELTAEKFITDPFSAEPGARLYRTGDLARYRPDGNIEFLGRRDQQVKLRGFRIELGEIEAVLAAHPQMAQAAVIAREDVPGNKTLAAYLVVQEPAPELTELRDFLLAQLPDYMVPAAFVILDKLPLTPNGKLDRAALPAPGQNRLGPAAEPVAPRTPTETALAHIWAGLLGLPQVGIHDNFFALGGHSLLAVRMISEIKRKINLNLPIRTLFEHPTIRELADILSVQNYKTKERKPELVQLQPGKAGPELFFIIDEGSLGLFKLGHLLDKSLPIYASVAPLPEKALRASQKKQSAALPKMEDLAAEHVALIKSRHTTGPILLAGHCFGGLLAFEVAHQLQTSGTHVLAVLLLDTWMVRPTFWWQKNAWLQEHFGKLLSEGPLYVWRKSRRRIKLEKNRLASRLELAIHDDFNVHVPWEIIVGVYRHAMKGYRPKPLASRGILYLSQDDWLSNAYRSSDESLGTDKMFTDGVQMINVPGNHVTILDEAHLLELADSFRKSLEPFQYSSKQ